MPSKPANLLLESGFQQGIAIPETEAYLKVEIIRFGINAARNGVLIVIALGYVDHQPRQTVELHSSQVRQVEVIDGREQEQALLVQSYQVVDEQVLESVDNSAHC